MVSNDPAHIRSARPPGYIVVCVGAHTMTDRIREQLKNRGGRYTRETAETQLKRIGLTLSADWNPKRSATPASQDVSGPELQRRTAGG